METIKLLSLLAQEIEFAMDVANVSGSKPVTHIELLHYLQEAIKTAKILEE